jgi:hypothetical protein
VEVAKVPGGATAASSIVSIVAVKGHTEPDTRMPLIHSAMIVCGVGRIDPVRSIPAGLRMVWSARVVTSNPLI